MIEATVARPKRSPYEMVSPFLTLDHAAASIAAFIGHGPIARDNLSYEPFRCPLFGLHRPIDEKIASYLYERQRALNRPLSILELGAGSSWGGLTSHYGAPWLSRALSTLDKEAFRITISDVADISAATQAFVLLIYYPQSQKLFIQALSEYSIKPQEQAVRFDFERENARFKRILAACSSRSHERLTPLSAMLINDDEDLKVILPEVLHLIEKLDPTSAAESPHIFLRPKIDTLLESFFGIEKILPHFNMLDPRSWDGDTVEKYDVIFARHQQTTRAAVIDWIKSQLMSKNIPAIMHFDGASGGDIIDTTT